MVSAVFASETENLSVPKEVMDYILKCGNNEHIEGRNRLFPVHNLEISDKKGITSHQVQMLGLSTIEDSLQKVFHNAEFAEDLFKQIDKELGVTPTFRASSGGIPVPSESTGGIPLPSDSTGGIPFLQEYDLPTVKQAPSCPPTSNIISIDVPPQELEVFHDRMERVTQQNNNLLLETIKHVIHTKISEVERNILTELDHRTTVLGALIDQRSSGLQEKLSLILQQLSKNVVSSTEMPQENKKPSLPEKLEVLSTMDTVDENKSSAAPTTTPAPTTTVKPTPVTTKKPLRRIPIREKEEKPQVPPKNKQTPAKKPVQEVPNKNMPATKKPVSVTTDIVDAAKSIAEGSHSNLAAMLRGKFVLS